MMKSMIEDKIRKKTRGVVLVVALKGYFLSLLAFCVSFYVYAAFVYFFPSFIRFHVDYLAVATTLIFAPLAVAVALLVRQEADTRRLAISLEESYPQLKDRLITAMEVSKRGIVTANPFSRALAKNLEFEMNEIMDRFGFRKAVSWRKVVVPGAILLLVVLAGSVHAMLQPRFFDVNYRLVKPSGAMKFPAMTRNLPILPSFSLTVSPGNCEIPKGSNLLVQVEAKGEIPSEVQLLLKQQSDPVWRIFVMNPAGNGKFQYQLTHVTEPCFYYVKAQNEQSPRYRIDLFEPLSILRAVWQVQYPPHTRIPQESREGWGPKMTVPAGTTLQLTLQMNRPVKEGRLLVQGGADVPLVPEGETRLKADFRVDSDMVLKLDIKSKDGEPLLGASSLWIQTLPDLDPYLEVLAPELHNYVFPTEEIPFSINVDDDYGIAAVDLVLRVRGQEHRISWLPANTEEPVRKTNLTPVLRLEDFELQSRDIVFGYVEVRDNHPGEPHVVKSALFTFLVRDYVEQFKLNSPDPQTPSLRSLFEDILVEQEQIMNDAWDYHSRLTGEEPKGFDNPPARGGK